MKRVTVGGYVAGAVSIILGIYISSTSPLSIPAIIMTFFVFLFGFVSILKPEVPYIVVNRIQEFGIKQRQIYDENLASLLILVSAVMLSINYEVPADLRNTLIPAAASFFGISCAICGIFLYSGLGNFPWFRKLSKWFVVFSTSVILPIWLAFGAIFISKFFPNQDAISFVASNVFVLVWLICWIISFFFLAPI